MIKSYEGNLIVPSAPKNRDLFKCVCMRVRMSVSVFLCVCRSLMCSVDPYIKRSTSMLRVATERGILQRFCLDVTRGRMNGAPNETPTYSRRFASLACQPLLHPIERGTWVKDICFEKYNI